ncbi:MAG: ABC transporter ATP-binding protein [Aggregatilineales bacterium]|nr:ABC transporter ATP-binding protein [Aggregatilineales bacterium]HPV07937.1 ABC transporter ATP-binding protein [Aggregatilineales bacterium]HQE18328.1 ABC transporter ATP-binding protein [Aggregatilineales bacterium]
MTSVQMRGITKRFPGVVANDSVDLDLYEGEVHGLLGENGAGKTTLMNILFGLYQPDEGQILLNERPVSIHSPADAINLGIGMIHQHFKLVAPFTVAENIILGLRGSLFIDMKKVQREIAKVAEQYGLEVDLDARVQELSVGEQQRVEILSSLYRGAQVLILDEPTAVLTPQEADNLGVILREMARQGKTIVFISHKLEEVMKVTDRVTVLRGGRVVFSSLTRETTKQELAREMIGRELSGLRSEQAAVVLALAGAEDASLAAEKIANGAQAVIEVTDLHVNDDRNLPAVRGVDLTVHRGEILGIAGVDGNGQHELVEAIVRLRPVQSGQIRLNGKDATRWDVRDTIAHNVAYISDDRQKDGLILNFDLSRNAVIKLFEREPFSRRGLLNFDAIDEFTKNLIEQFDVRTPGPHVAAAKLSGGNQQKLILARELSQSPSVIIANKPTRGLDIGAAAYVHERLLAERERGAAILLLSADLDEILLLSDRILVMCNGQSMGVLERQHADVQTLGLMMAGTPLASIEKQGAIS